MEFATSVNIRATQVPQSDRRRYPREKAINRVMVIGNGRT